MSESSFLFLKVNHTGKVSADKTVRTAIQKHVMRDIGAARRGKSRPRPRPNSKFRLRNITSGNKTPELDETRDGSNSPIIQVPTLVSGGLRTDPFVKYPVSMSSDTLFLVDYVYTTPEPRLRPFRDTWLPLAFSDSAFFYEILSHIALDLASAQSPLASCTRHSYQSDPKYLALHSLALRSINQRLADPVMGLSDGVIGTILAFACFSHSSKDWKSYAMHMDGLVTIIKAKGGIHKIDHNRILRLILSGIDVSASCFCGTPPRFPTPAHMLTSLRSYSQELPWWLPLPSEITYHTNIWTIMFPRDTILADIFNELSATVMAIKLESDKRVVWQDKQFTKNWIDPLTYRLLESSVEIENVHNGNFLAECCRLGALILLSKIRRCFNVDTTRLVFTGQETANLRFLLSSYADQWTMFQPMLLWVSFLGALEVEGEEKVWFCDLIKTTSQQLMIQEWDEILVSASNLLWVGKVLDMECEMLKPLIENNTD